MIILSFASLLIVSLSHGSHWLAYFGIVCASLSGGLGEVTFLSFSSKFPKNVVSGWSSGTGAAGLIGAGSYQLLRLFLFPETTLQVMLVVPFILTATFWCLIVHPKKDYPEAVATRPLLVTGGDESPFRPFNSRLDIDVNNDSSVSTINSNSVSRELTVRQKLGLITPLMKYMVPLALVYFWEYFINQGLFELVFFPGAFLNHEQQYQAYQTLYQLGVFISRSSVQFFEVDKLWLLPILQFFNWALFFAHVIVPYIPSIWIVFILIIYEGLLGGGAYVNTFYKISKEVSYCF